ncbi:hypothetical protein GHT06_003782 [Daphnia sinensis]|uniref:Uncharacterized protein n=1 Tax=Daphnia sinensis TaxID=1820382 RepID=A0AAD5KTP9_9CRUS|nr:hypothetical protein GHT06_003782 [Daphnia sinensis]
MATITADETMAKHVGNTEFKDVYEQFKNDVDKTDCDPTAAGFLLRTGAFFLLVLTSIDSSGRVIGKFHPQVAAMLSCMSGAGQIARTTDLPGVYTELTSCLQRILGDLKASRPPKCEESAMAFTFSHMATLATYWTAVYVDDLLSSVVVPIKMGVYTETVDPVEGAKEFLMPVVCKRPLGLQAIAASPRRDTKPVALEREHPGRALAF